MKRYPNPITAFIRKLLPVRPFTKSVAKEPSEKSYIANAIASPRSSTVCPYSQQQLFACLSEAFPTPVIDSHELAKDTSVELKVDLFLQ